MCIQRGIEYFPSIEPSHDVVTDGLNWPFEQPFGNKLMVACDVCYYPITFEEHIVDEIKNERNIPFGIVIPIGKFFNRVVVIDENNSVPWRTFVYCPNCALLLSFLTPYRSMLSEQNFRKISEYKSIGEQVVILWTSTLYRGPELEAYSQFTRMANGQREIVV